MGNPGSNQHAQRSTLNSNFKSDANGNITEQTAFGRKIFAAEIDVIKHSEDGSPALSGAPRKQHAGQRRQERQR